MINDDLRWIQSLLTLIATICSFFPLAPCATNVVSFVCKNDYLKGEKWLAEEGGSSKHWHPWSPVFLPIQFHFLKIMAVNKSTDIFIRFGSLFSTNWQLRSNRLLSQEKNIKKTVFSIWHKYDINSDLLQSFLYLLIIENQNDAKNL